MPKGKIEAFCMAIMETNTKLLQSLEHVSSQINLGIKESLPFDNENMNLLLVHINAAVGLSRSNQVQLKGMLQEAYEKGV